MMCQLYSGMHFTLFPLFKISPKLFQDQNDTLQKLYIEENLYSRFVNIQEIREFKNV